MYEERRDECEDCRRLVELYGEENLNICSYCGHYYLGDTCTCSGGEEQ